MLMVKKTIEIKREEKKLGLVMISDENYCINGVQNRDARRKGRRNREESLQTNELKQRICTEYHEKRTRFRG